MELRKVYERARVVHSGRYPTTVNEFTDQLPALRPRVLWEAALAVVQRADPDCTKVLVEEDKGAPLGTVVALILGLPLAMARRYTYDPGSHRVDYESEYVAGDLRVNGIEPGDRVLIVDDTISTGGVLVALISAVEEIGATLGDVVAVIEKVDNKGVERVQDATGVTVKTILQITIDGSSVVVLPNRQAGESVGVSV